MRKPMLIVLLICLLLPAVVNADPIELRVADAINLALEQNLDLRLLRLDYEWALSEVERAKFVGDEQMYKTAVENFNQVAEQYQQQQKSLSRQVVTSYYEVLQTELSVAKAYDQVKQARLNYEQEQVRFQAGLIPQITLLRAENQITLAESSYINAQHNLETAYLEFKQLLGLALDQDILLVELIEPEYEPIDVSFQEAYAGAQLVSKELQAAQEAVDLASRQVSQLDNEYTPRVELEKAKVQLEKAKVQLEKVTQTLYFQVRSAYWTLKNGEQEIEAKERELVLAEKELQSARAKYQAGLISEEELAGEEQKYNEAERALKEAKWAHRQRSLDFLEMIGLAKPVWSEGQDALDSTLSD